MRLALAAVLGASLLVVGCSSSDKKEPQPMALEKIQEEVTLNKVWSRSVGNGQGKLYNRLVPAVYGDQIYVAGADGEVSSIDRHSGKVVWSKKLKEPVSGAISAAYGKVLIGTLKGDVIALDVSDGDELWRHNVAREVLAAPISNGDRVIVQTQDDSLIGLDESTGSQVWILENSPAVLTLRGTSTPLVTNDVVYAGLSTGKIIAVEAQRGLPIWEQRIAIPQGRSELERIVDVDGDLTLLDGKLYAASWQGRAAVLDANSGQVLWQRDASTNSGLAQGYGSVYLSLADGTVEAIDERSNTVLWTNESLLRRQLTPPTAYSSYVAVGDLEGYVHLLSQVDGRFVGRTRADSNGLRSAFVADGDWLYTYGNGGTLSAFNIKQK
mgnify:CR=1 FL=1